MPHPHFVETDKTVPIGAQLGTDDGAPVILANTFVVPPAAVDDFLAAWAADAAIMQAQPGFLDTQLHRGIAGSGAFLNIATWASVAAFRAAFGNPAFRASLADYPAGITTSPHLFRKEAVPGVCGG